MQSQLHISDSDLYDCVHNISISHPQPGRLENHRQGRVPLRCTLVKDKASKQKQLHWNKRRNFQKQGISALCGKRRQRWGDRDTAWGEMVNRRHEDNPATTVSLPGEGSQGRVKWRKSNKPLFLYFSFITCLSAITESIHNGGSKQISLFAHQKRDYIYPFPPSEKVEARWKCVWERKLFDESMSDWGSRKRGFSVSLCQIYLERRQICSWGTWKQPELDNKYDPRKLRDVILVVLALFSLNSLIWVSEIKLVWCNINEVMCRFNHSMDRIITEKLIWYKLTGGLLFSVK